MNYQDHIIVALDTQDKTELNRLLRELRGNAKFVKIGMELFYTFGPKIVEKIKKNFNVFLDLKIHDIPHTAVKTSLTLAQLGVDMINYHAAGGKEMMIAVKDEMDSLKFERPMLLGVTHLTSSSNMTLKEQFIERPIDECVEKLSFNVKEAGFDGVVASAQDAKNIKYNCSENFLVITPGIRPKGFENNDQKRITSPSEAFQNGSDYIVIGRPITQSASPALMFNKILKEIEG